jgi:hypothetical protein
MRPWIPLLLASLATTASPGLAQGEPGRIRGGDAVVESLVALVEAEQKLLGEALENYRSLARQRGEALVRLTQLHESLDGEIDREQEAVPDRLDQLVGIAEHAAADLGARLASERRAANRVRMHVRRIVALEHRVRELEGNREPEAVGLLDGTWDLVLLPLDQNGSCVLQQSGAVVTGTYRLQGGYSGSLQGTLVNRKVYLVRIDSRLGKMMELEGFVSDDGEMIRGTWLNYELAGAEGSTGHWSAKRRSGS